MSNKYLTTSQAAAFLHVSRFTILNWIKNGKLVAITTLGGHQRIPQESIATLLAKKESAHQKINTLPKSSITPCWKAKEARDCGRHNCPECLVFKEQLSRCFLVIRNFGTEKVQCGIDCLSCDYLTAFYPKERKIIEAGRAKRAEKTTSVAQPESLPKTEKDNLLKKGFYASGKYFALLKNTGKKK
jgi:excisionase family DNA binding protein